VLPKVVPLHSTFMVEATMPKEVTFTVPHDTTARVGESSAKRREGGPEQDTQSVGGLIPTHTVAHTHTHTHTHTSQAHCCTLGRRRSIATTARPLRSCSLPGCH
jgi:hypothetical protein